MADWLVDARNAGTTGLAIELDARESVRVAGRYAGKTAKTADAGLSEMNPNWLVIEEDSCGRFKECGSSF